MSEASPRRKKGKGKQKAVEDQEWQPKGDDESDDEGDAPPERDIDSEAESYCGDDGDDEEDEDEDEEMGEGFGSLETETPDEAPSAASPPTTGALTTLEIWDRDKHSVQRVGDKWTPTDYTALRMGSSRAQDARTPQQKRDDERNF